MKFNYYPETESLYIELAPGPSAETREVANGLNVDLDASGNVIGFDIDNAARNIDSLRRHIDARFDVLHAELVEIKRAIPLYEFWHRSPLAQQLIEQLRIAEANRPREHEVYPVPQR